MGTAQRYVILFKESLRSDLTRFIYRNPKAVGKQGLQPNNIGKAKKKEEIEDLEIGQKSKKQADLQPGEVTPEEEMNKKINLSI